MTRREYYAAYYREHATEKKAYAQTKRDEMRGGPSTRTPARTYPNRNAATRAWRAAHPEQAAAWAKAWRAKNKAAIKASARLRKYGINADEQRCLFDSQYGRCAICTSSLDFDTAHLDHDHDTKQVRGFLCGSCNRGIGFFRDRERLLRSAISYLSKHAPKLKLVR